MITQLEKYGVINSIVLSRSGESDNVYLRDEESVAQNGLTEVKIIDNQIMNFNNRSDFLEGILNALDGLEYYLNDYESTGILYYEVGDLYNVQIGENVYQCLMLNDEVNVTTGIKEIIHTDLPEKSETDYEKADKTDRKINQTTLIVNKQNQTIESVVNQIGDRSQKSTTITQDIDGVDQKVESIADITTTQETNIGSLTFEDINPSEPIHIEIKPRGESIRYLYPCDLLFPSDDLFIQLRLLRFKNITTNENFDYELPDDLLYYDSENYDMFVLDYYSHTVYVDKKCKFNFTTKEVELLEQQIRQSYDFPDINLTEGDYVVEVLKYDDTPYICYLMTKLMIDNEYTSQFATKTAVSSEIKQSNNEINLKLEEKLDEENFTGANIMLAINNDSSSAQINADKIGLDGKEIDMTAEHIKIKSSNFNVDEEGNIEAKSGTLGGWNINTEGLTNGDVFVKSNGYASIYTVADYFVVRNYLQGRAGFEFSNVEIEHYDLDNDGVITSTDLLILRRMVLGY